MDCSVQLLLMPGTRIPKWVLAADQRVLVRRTPVLLYRLEEEKYPVATGIREFISLWIADGKAALGSEFVFVQPRHRRKSRWAFNANQVVMVVSAHRNGRGEVVTHQDLNPQFCSEHLTMGCRRPKHRKVA